MAQMTLAGYTFAMNPARATLPHTERLTTFAPTLGGAEFFSWGTTIKGKVIRLYWDYMPLAQWNQFISILTADSSCSWTTGGGNTYTVEILSLNGEYFIDNSALAEFRRDVNLEMIIMA
jgi:hypothetical protein